MNADPIARVYRVLEYATFGPMLWRARTHFIQHLKDKQRILIAGEGDGRFLAALLELNPKAQIDIYDTSAKMIELAKSRTTAHSYRLNFHHADITRAQLRIQTYDAIVANFFFDCFNDQQLSQLINHLMPAATPDCLWYLSDFRLPNKTIPRAAAKLLIRTLYAAFRITTGLNQTSLPDYQQLLSEARLTRIESASHAAGLLTSQIWTRPAPHRGSNSETCLRSPRT